MFLKKWSKIKDFFLKTKNQNTLMIQKRRTVLNVGVCACFFFFSIFIFAMEYNPPRQKLLFYFLGVDSSTKNKPSSKNNHTRMTLRNLDVCIGWTSNRKPSNTPHVFCWSSFFPFLLKRCLSFVGVLLSVCVCVCVCVLGKKKSSAGWS